MGRIKTLMIKRVTHDLVKKHGDRFTTDFYQNKKIIDELVESQSKKLKNIVTGYTTRLVKEMRNPRSERPRAYREESDEGSY